VVELLALAFLGLWFAVTVGYQLQLPFLLRFNFRGFVPLCHFFAPKPTSTDVRVYYWCGEDPVSGVDEIVWKPLIRPNKGRIRAFWNPNQRLEKSLSNIARRISHLRRIGADVFYSVPYLRLLNVAEAHAACKPEGEYLRFIVTRHGGMEDESKFIFLTSHAHRLSDAAPGS